MSRAYQTPFFFIFSLLYKYSSTVSENEEQEGHCLVLDDFEQLTIKPYRYDVGAATTTGATKKVAGSDPS